MSLLTSFTSLLVIRHFFIIFKVNVPYLKSITEPHRARNSLLSRMKSGSNFDQKTKRQTSQKYRVDRPFLVQNYSSQVVLTTVELAEERQLPIIHSSASVTTDQYSSIKHCRLNDRSILCTYHAD